MKTQDLFISYEKKEKIVRIFSLVSLIGVIIGIIFGFLYLIFKDPLFDSIATYGLTVFVLPLVFLQFFMTAGIYGTGLGWIYFLFYLVIFPFGDIWFFSGINSIFQIIPNYPLVETITPEEFMTKAWIYIGGIYVFMNGLGLLYRALKKLTRNKLTIALSI